MSERTGTNCAGHPVSWAPDWQDSECGECGHVTGRYDAAEPRATQHNMIWRDGSLFCYVCNAEGTPMDKAFKVTEDNLRAHVTTDFEKTNRLFEHLRGTQRG